MQSPSTRVLASTTLLREANPQERGLDPVHVDGAFLEEVRDGLHESLERTIKVLVDKKAEDVHHIDLPGD